MHSVQNKSHLPLVAICKWPGVTSALSVIAGIALLASCTSWSHPPLTDPPTAQLSATSITNPTQGNQDRCELIYPDLYAKTLKFLKLIVAKNPDEIYNAEAKRTIINSKTMLTNMMLSSERPIHPAAFFAVIKDFESSISNDYWSVKHFHSKSSTKWCTSGTCSGYFQVDVQLEPTWSLYGICGPGGLDFLGHRGGPDYCAALWWWNSANGGSKCRTLKDVGTYVGPAITSRVCNYSSKVNPCTTPNVPWTTGTFAYAYECAYIQQNQWWDHGINDSWQKMYTGFFYDHNFPRRHKRITIPHKQVDGYEYCAVKHFAERHYRKGTHEWPQFSSAAIPSNLLRAAVHQFAAAIGITPPWAPYPWRPLSATEQAAILAYNINWTEANKDKGTSPHIEPTATTLPADDEVQPIISPRPF